MSELFYLRLFFMKSVTYCYLTTADIGILLSVLNNSAENDNDLMSISLF